MAEKILIIDAEAPANEATFALLDARNYEVYLAQGAQDGLRAAYNRQPDLVLLDAVLPDRDGWQVCRQLREMSDMPIIFHSAKTASEDVAAGLELGADAYLRKPCPEAELVAWIKAVLRRSPRARLSEEIAFKQGEFRMNFLNREVWIRGELKHLTPKEFNLLAVLVRNAGRVVSRTELVSEAWGAEYSDAIDSLKLYIHYLRRKLEINPQQPEYIRTSRGVGYRFMKS